MRQIGRLENEGEAVRFAAYLVTRGILSHAENEDDQWAIWVRDEDRVEQASEELAAFRRQPNDAQYRGAEQTAERLLREKAKRHEAARKNVVVMRGQWNRLQAKKRPLTLILIALSILVFIMTSGGEASSGPVMNALRFNEWRDRTSAEDSMANKLSSLMQGQLWRAFTPMFIHFGIMHIAMNLFCLFYFGGQIESRIGAVKYGALVLVIAAASNIGQALAPMELGGSGFGLFGGMSGVVYGLFGYMWVKTTFEPGSGFQLSQLTIIILVGWFFFCIARDVMAQPDVQRQAVANWAHGVGLVCGMLIGLLPHRKS